jgi:hypothetical protein
MENRRFSYAWKTDLEAMSFTCPCTLDTLKFMESINLLALVKGYNCVNRLWGLCVKSAKSKYRNLSAIKN